MLGVVLISAVFTGIIISAITPKPMFHGDYPYYPDVASITDAADVVIIGKVVTANDVKELMIDKTPNKADKETTPYTLSTVKVTRVVKGNVQVGDMITIKQLGDYQSKPEAALYAMDGYLKKDSVGLMFLCKYDDSPYSAVNPAQGIVQVINDNELYSSNKYSVFGYSDSSTKREEVESLDKVIAKIKENID
ncbi:MAG: hypothetical protein GX424_02325 [Clostridiales bacterium]|nr:hypothetical protein [Clostridiales bacterium]